MAQQTDVQDFPLAFWREYGTIKVLHLLFQAPAGAKMLGLIQMLPDLLDLLKVIWYQSFLPPFQLGPAPSPAHVFIIP